MKRINSSDKRRMRENLCNRFGGRCAYCNRPAGLKAGTVDHYVPQALGGTNAQHNLRWSCRACNEAKADMPPEEWEERRPEPVMDPVSRRAALLQAIAQRARGAGA